MATATRPAGYAGREVTHPPNWHGLVVWDVFFNAATTGLFLVTAVGELARPDVFAPLAVWAYPVALVVLLADLACLVLDLGNPTRFHHMLRVFKPLSPMSLGTWCLTAYSLPLTALVAVDLFAPVGWFRTVLLVVGLPFAFGSAAYKGVLFSTTAQPGWRDARWLGAYHASGALALGGAVLLLGATVAGNTAAIVLRPALGVLVLLNLLPLALLAAELRPALARAHAGGARAWFPAALLCGVVLPLGLLVAGEWVTDAVAAVLVLAVGFGVRSVVVHLPHAVAHREGK